MRIRAKRCRYAAEAVAPAVGKRPERFAKAVAELQDVLGEHQDAVVAGQWLREHVPARRRGGRRSSRASSRRSSRAAAQALARGVAGGVEAGVVGGKLRRWL